MLLGQLMELMEDWRHDAATFRRRGREADAEFAESFANDLEHVLAALYRQSVPIEEAGPLVGYSKVQLGRYIEAEDIKLVETRNGPEVRLIQLPVKAGRLQALLGDLPTERNPDEPIRIEQARHANRKSRIKAMP
jgi:hypothetical protein